jgi:glucose/arabinose dehydrogenase
VLLGKLLRLDVDGALPYAIPDGNPFKGVAGKRAEIWDYGLRNPWRYAFDRTTGRLYIGDVGQSAWEEVDVEEPGAGGVNYGWNIMEGMHCYGSSSCDQTGLVLPKYEYGHGEGCAIVGGYVYRGTRIPGVVGQYFFSDLCSGFLRSFTYAGGAATNVTTWNVGSIGQPWSFGEDNDGELYIVTGGGTVYRIDPPPASGQ